MQIIRFICSLVYTWIVRSRKQKISTECYISMLHRCTEKKDRIASQKKLEYSQEVKNNVHFSWFSNDSHLSPNDKDKQQKTLFSFPAVT